MIETQNLSKAYGPGFHALKHLTLTIDKGEFVFLTGASGAGKSTLLRMLLLQERPTEGDVIVAGRNLSRLSPADVQAYRRSVGFVFQDFKLIPTKTVFENVSFALRVLGVPIDQQRRRTYQVLKWVGLQHRLQAYPLELSGGEQQRVAIARALVNDPQLVLADEPTGNLDSKNGEAVMALLDELHQSGSTICMVTHDARYADFAQRKICMFDGRIVDEDTLHRLRREEEARLDAQIARARASHVAGV